MADSVVSANNTFQDIELSETSVNVDYLMLFPPLFYHISPLTLKSECKT